MSTKTSLIWAIEKEKLQEIMNNSSSLAEVLRKLNFDPTTGGHYKTLNDRIKIEFLNMEKLILNRRNSASTRSQNKIPLEKIFVENSSYNRGCVKKKIIKQKFLDYRCEICNISDMYNGKKLSLELDHKNGINNDNRLENLRLLCPNCHSQCDTSKRKDKIKNNTVFCHKCNKKVSKGSKMCVGCNNKNKKVKLKFTVTKEELEKLIKEKPFTQIGKMFNVTDNTIRKRCKKLNIEIPKYPKGYWLKIKTGD